jgi:hypothetical protein
MFDRFFRSDEGRWTPPSQIELVRALNDHDIGRLRAALPDDFVFRDHRRTGVGRIGNADDYVASMAAVFEQSRDVPPTPSTTSPSRSMDRSVSAACSARSSTVVRSSPSSRACPCTGGDGSSASSCSRSRTSIAPGHASRSCAPRRERDGPRASYDVAPRRPSPHSTITQPARSAAAPTVSPAPTSASCQGVPECPAPWSGVVRLVPKTPARKSAPQPA